MDTTNGTYLFFQVTVCFTAEQQTVIEKDRWSVDTSETCRGVLRNIPKINCASSWIFLK